MKFGKFKLLQQSYIKEQPDLKISMQASFTSGQHEPMTIFLIQPVHISLYLKLPQAYVVNVATTNEFAYPVMKDIVTIAS